MEFSIWINHWKKLVDKWNGQGYESFTTDERIWFNVRCLIDAIDNGGVISFYYNHEADYLTETMEDLAKLNANEIIDVLNSVNRLFPNGRPSKSIDERNAVIESWEDGKYDSLFEKLDKKFYMLEEGLKLNLEPIIKRILQ